MKQPKVKVLLRTDKPLTDNSFPIWIRITHLRKSNYIATGYSCQEEEWDSETCRLYEVKPRITAKEKEDLKPEEIKDLKLLYAAIKVNSLAKKTNAEIDKQVRKVLTTKDKLEANEQNLSSKIIKRQLTTANAGCSDKSLLQYWDKQNCLLLANESFRTAKSYKSSLKTFKTFLKGRDLTFEDLTSEVLENYEVYLKGKGNKKDTIHKHLKTLRAVYYKAIREQIIGHEKNPFFVYKLKQETHKKKDRLTLEEIHTLQQVDLPEHSNLWNARNIFLFSFYNAGIRIGDLLQLTWGNITKEGRLEYIMGKTGKVRSIKLIPQAKGILSLYKPSKPGKGSYIFPFLRNDINRLNKAYFSRQIESKTAIVNKCLKQIAEKAEIDKKLTSHISRHSFADIARKRSSNLFDIQSLLGHSDIKTTKRYLANFDLESQDQAHEAVFEGL